MYYFDQFHNIIHNKLKLPGNMKNSLPFINYLKVLFYTPDTPKTKVGENIMLTILQNQG